MLSPSRLGTAEWTDPGDFEREFVYKPGAVWLGRSLTPASPPVGVADDRHVLLVAGTRSGKGATIIVNNLCLWPGSAVVIDPKGENATLTASRRGNGSAHCNGLGQTVHVLDPYEIAKVDPTLRKRFNPLDVFNINKSTCPKDVTRLVISLIPLAATEDNWSERAARRLLYGIILHVLTAPEFEGRRNLITVRELICRGDLDIKRRLEEAGEADVPSAFALLWAGMIQNSAFNGEVADQGLQFREVQSEAPKQWTAVHDDAVNALQFINNDNMRDCLSYSDFKLADLKRDSKGVTVFLCIPEDYLHEDFRWLRTIVSLVTSELRAESGPPASGHPVLMLLDEFPTLQRMDSIETGIATMAGYGLKFFFVVQNFGQLKRHYQEWETFAGNCGIKIAFGVEDHFTREYISKLIGETELVRETRNTSEARAEGGTTTRGTGKSWGKSTNESVARSRGKNRNRSWGGSRGSSSSSGQSDGASWTPGGFFRSLQAENHWFRENETASRNQSQERGQNRGSNWGGSSGSNQGVTRTVGTGTSYSHSTNESESFSDTVTNTTGFTETLQRRALVAPDEVGRFFSRARDFDDPTYPGLGLVLLAGMNPVAVQRVRYFEDPVFRDLFDPHPDHKTHIVELYFPDPVLIPVFFQLGGGFEVTLRRGAVSTGATMAVVQPFPPLADHERLHFRAPFPFRLVSVEHLDQVHFTKGRSGTPVRMRITYDPAQSIERSQVDLRDFDRLSSDERKALMGSRNLGDLSPDEIRDVFLKEHGMQLRKYTDSCLNDVRIMPTKVWIAVQVLSKLVSVVVVGTIVSLAIGYFKSWNDALDAAGYAGAIFLWMVGHFVFVAIPARNRAWNRAEEWARNAAVAVESIACLSPSDQARLATVLPPE